jgi:hypothetical protein
VVHAVQADFVFVGLILLIGFLCTGAVLPELGELGVEAFFNGKRVRGSCRHRPLPQGLEEDDPSTAPVVLVLRLQLLRLLSDGCAAQFNSCHFQLWLQVSWVLASGAGARFGHHR